MNNYYSVNFLGGIMKKIISLLIFMAILVLACACGAQNGGDTVSTDDYSQGATTSTTNLNQGGTTSELTSSTTTSAEPEPEYEYLSFYLSSKGYYWANKKDNAIMPEVLVIPGSYKGIPVKYIDFEEFCGCDEITEIVICEGVEEIANSAFSTCSNVKKITLPKSIKKIGKSAFYNCVSLAEVCFTDSVSGLEFGYNIFGKCKSLVKINLPAGITIVEDFMFCDCTSLKEINIPEGVVEIGSTAFANSSSLETVRIPKSVTEISSNSFNNCTSLKNIVFGGTKSEWEKASQYTDLNSDSRGCTITCSDGTVGK